jgi:hypothetical protein
MGDAASTAGNYISNLGGQALGALTPGNTTVSDGVNLFANDSPGSYSNVGGTQLGAINPAQMAGTVGGSFESGAAPVPGLDTAAMGTGLQGAADWAKKNSSLVDTGLKAGLALTKQNSPAPASTAAYNTAAAGNAAKSAVGTSMVNQAPFMANNAEAASKGAGANASSALQQRLEQQGYKPGDAMYESMMQQQNLGNRANDATAYAAGQGQTATQEATGAGLMTPSNLDAYGALGTQQKDQQTSQNQTAADLATAGKTAFDIWSNPDKTNKTDTTNQ